MSFRFWQANCSIRRVIRTRLGRAGLLVTLWALLAFQGVGDPLDHWMRRNLDSSGLLRAVAYGNGRFVAVGDQGVIFTSVDGVAWTPCASGSIQNLWTIAYGKGLFVTAEFPSSSSHNRPFDRAVLTSTDGTNWARTLPSDFDYILPIRNVIFAQDIFVVAQSDSYTGGIASSLDGSHWTNWLITSFEPIMSAAYGNGLFLCAGGFTYTSPNGTNWTQKAGPTPPQPVFFGSAAFGNGVFVGIGWQNSTHAALFTTTDGAEWTAVPKDGPPFFWGAVIFAHDTFVIAADQGALLTSTNGSDWVVRAPGEFADLDFIQLTYGNGTVVAVGINGAILQSDHYGPPLVKLSKPAPAQAHLTVSAEKDKLCKIEISPDFASWSELYRYTNFDGLLEFDDLSATNALEFYRVRTE